MNHKKTNARISKLARINESVGNINFEAIQDEESTEWIVRMGIVRIVHSVSEVEAKKIVEILNKGIGTSIQEIVSTNAFEIKTLIDNMATETEEVP